MRHTKKAWQDEATGWRSIGGASMPFFFQLSNGAADWMGSVTFLITNASDEADAKRYADKWAKSFRMIVTKVWAA